MEKCDVSRRRFMSGTTVAGAAAFQIIRPELVRGWADEKLKVGLIGCGGRGTQAAQQLLFGNDNVELVAMGDIFEDRLEKSLKEIRGGRQYPVADKVKVTPDAHFVGFDSYKKVLASDIDIVMLATPPGYRPEHFEAAVEAKKHIFSEKPFGTDPVGVRKVMAATEKARQLKLTVMTGAQRRNQQEYTETWQKVKDGAIGDIVAAYAWWVGTPRRTPPRCRRWRHLARTQGQAGPKVGRHDVPEPVVVLLRVGVRRPGGGAAPAQHRRVQLVHGHAPGPRVGLRRRHLAAP